MLETTFDKRLKIQAWIDQIFRRTTQLFALLVLVILASIIIYLFKGALPAIKEFHGYFFFSSAWNPITEQFGALVSITGTLITSIIALLIGIPISFGIALFLTSIAPNWLRYPLRIAIELLAGIPSIIYGMWGLFVFAPVLSNYVQPWLIENLGDLA